MRHAVIVLWLLAYAGPVTAEDNWPQFRGPRGDGTSNAVGLPVTWSETEHVRWKTAIHGRGWSSPVVWGNQAWMTTASDDGRQRFAVAVDVRSGQVVHDVRVFEVETPEAIQALNSYASPTPVIEEGRVWVHFGSVGTACLDTASGKILWTRRDLNCDHFRGAGSSPILFGRLLILHFDGIDVQYLAALDKTSGQTVWRTDRSTDFAGADGDLRKAYSTPLTAEVGGRTLLLSPGAKAAMAYLPETGKEVWKIRYGGFSNTSRPLFGGGLAFLNTGFGKPELWAVRPDGEGDVTDTHVVWRLNKSVPAKPSPLLIGELIYMVDDRGVASCVEAKTGDVVWHERIGGEHSASPIYADGRIYVFDQDGKATVLAPGREFKVLTTNRLEAGCMASPAVVGQSLLVRTKTALYRIE